MKRKWKMGLVGVAGRNRAIAYTHHPNVEVTALMDIDGQALQKVGQFYNLSENSLYTNYGDFLNADIDIVIISTPMQFHAQQAIDALDAGKHVLSEVTAAYTLEDCQQLLQAVERNHQVYMLAENYIYFHYIRQWKKWIDQGRLGMIVHAEAEYIHEIRNLLQNEKTGETYWRYERPPIYYCTHTLGPILHILGDDRIVRATGVGKCKHGYPDGGDGFIDMQVGLFETAHGRSIKILRSQSASRHPEVVHYSMQGTKGFVENGKLGYNTKGLLYLDGEPGYEMGAIEIDCPTSDPKAPLEARKGGHGTSEYYLIRDFIQSVESGSCSNPIDIYKGMEITMPGLVAFEAIKQGGIWLDVPKFR